jgi:FlaA1/EpsC-like NDP-sugar epimerase
LIVNGAEDGVGLAYSAAEPSRDANRDEAALVRPVGAGTAVVGVGLRRRLEGARRSLSAGLAGALLQLRGRHLFAIDLASVVVSIMMSVQLVDDRVLQLGTLVAYLPAIAVPLAVRPVVNTRLGLYRRLWSHASVPELAQIVLAMIVGTALGIGGAILLTETVAGAATELPAGFWILEFVISLAGAGGIRFAIRAASEVGTRAIIAGETVSLTPALLFGAGRGGALAVRAARREPAAGVKPVGFLDEDRTKWGSTVAGLTVYGNLDHLGEAIRRTGARMLLIALPNPSGATVRRIMAEGMEAGLQVRTLPPVRGLVDGTWTTHRARDIRVEDLLAREQVTTHVPSVAETISGQVVMVTGAGGSIGSELARQVYAFGPKQLVLVDRAESPLYMIQRELELRGQDGRGSGELSVHLGNVASRALMSRLISRTRPAVIFHAAACKHVPMMEEHPSEGVQVNVGGTMAVLSAAVEAGVPRFVLVSTDKAVEPSSVMGATKRLAEWLVAEAATATGRPYVAVRFGNVLGSAGSVLPIFQGQLENDEPITITHPAMTRYFMTIQEAGWLILDAAAVGNPGDLFVLDMGEPVKIVDMARDLIRLAGRNESDVTIRFTGLRPGEKLHERLFYESEQVVSTGVDKLLRVINADAPADVSARARDLLARALGDTDDELRQALFDVVSPWAAQALEAPVGRPDEESLAIPATGDQGLARSDPATSSSRGRSGAGASGDHRRDAAASVDQRDSADGTDAYAAQL